MYYGESVGRESPQQVRFGENRALSNFPVFFTFTSIKQALGFLGDRLALATWRCVTARDRAAGEAWTVSCWNQASYQSLLPNRLSTEMSG